MKGRRGGGKGVLIHVIHFIVLWRSGVGGKKRRKEEDGGFEILKVDKEMLRLRRMMRLLAVLLCSSKVYNIRVLKLLSVTNWMKK